MTIKLLLLDLGRAKLGAKDEKLSGPGANVTTGVNMKLYGLGKLHKFGFYRYMTVCDCRATSDERRKGWVHETTCNEDGECSYCGYYVYHVTPKRDGRDRAKIQKLETGVEDRYVLHNVLERPLQ